MVEFGFVISLSNASIKKNIYMAITMAMITIAIAIMLILLLWRHFVNRTKLSLYLGAKV